MIKKLFIALLMALTSTTIAAMKLDSDNSEIGEIELKEQSTIELLSEVIMKVDACQKNIEKLRKGLQKKDSVCIKENFKEFSQETIIECNTINGSSITKPWFNTLSSQQFFHILVHDYMQDYQQPPTQCPKYPKCSITPSIPCRLCNNLNTIDAKGEELCKTVFLSLSNIALLLNKLIVGLKQECHAREQDILLIQEVMHLSNAINAAERLAVLLQMTSEQAIIPAINFFSKHASCAKKVLKGEKLRLQGLLADLGKRFF